ncbi:hypothetical protein TruAng_010136 [Truncatella angustata]|nr:hypothetical protein TruAng_010136 [Truncatella angustata]
MRREPSLVSAGETGQLHARLLTSAPKPTLCSYDRPVKKRGRTRLAARSKTSGTAAVIESQEEAAERMPSASTTSALSFLVDPIEDDSADSGEDQSDEPTEVSGRESILRRNGFGDHMSQALSLPSPMSVWQSSSLPATSHCRYPVLQPLLPHLNGILSVSTACELFDVYLTDPGSSLFKFAPPYILTRIFRRKSLLHPTSPRPMSCALLAAILWCCAQAAEVPSLLAPGARSRTTRTLYNLAVSLINEKATGRWWRTDTQSLSEQTLGVSTTGERCESLTMATDDIQAQLGAVDDVLTFLLLCIAVSGGEFKADCEDWWHRATRTSRSLELHREDEPCLQLGLTCTKPLCSCHMQQPGAQNLSFVEAKEERRRVFWLLYCLDRHLALSFNRTLQIPDSYVEVKAPLPERIWEDLDEIVDNMYPMSTLGPPTSITGTGFFEYFLPLMVILGDIIELHHGRQHPRLHDFCNDGMSLLIEAHISECHESLKVLNEDIRSSEAEAQNRTQLVLLHSKWDAISMLDNDDGWIATQDFSKCASHAIAASEAVSRILEFDPELGFIPSYAAVGVEPECCTRVRNHYSRPRSLHRHFEHRVPEEFSKGREVDVV